MRILCIGDVCAPSGTEALLKALPTLKKTLKADAVIVNGENSAEGNGISLWSSSVIFSV